MQKEYFIPALRFGFLTPIYDWFIAFFIPEKSLKQKAIAYLEVQEGDWVLDFGCGTGTLCNLMLERHPNVRLIGIDVFEDILAIAQKKRQREYQLVHYLGGQMPFETDNFDCAISTWVFHHLSNTQKKVALEELYRILKPGGKLLIADWGKPVGLIQQTLFFIVCLVDNFKTFALHKKGGFPEFVRAAGFREVDELEKVKTLFGTLYYWRMEKL
ncbi:class I SAM-dependent methyltransferase [Marinilongibacter aquaticus]|uniref:class I SAM-dependent methyltransferase n=1 Tax=Marinilongibacter aquaticus TaxID=2975157 RepID=UPI0021BD04C9|nr:class I SAM-dependent methyltransferase [Marinilongibacter aquaticus]UBM59038.1 class I SAM-dependent methyltransferase [Marinilongibacter aquaticus]